VNSDISLLCLLCYALLCCAVSAAMCCADMNTEVLSAIANATSIDFLAEGGNLTLSTVSVLRRRGVGPV
jgi:hypothetical protein